MLSDDRTLNSDMQLETSCEVKRIAMVGEVY